MALPSSGERPMACIIIGPANITFRICSGERLLISSRVGTRACVWLSWQVAQRCEYKAAPSGVAGQAQVESAMAIVERLRFISACGLIYHDPGDRPEPRASRADAERGACVRHVHFSGNVLFHEPG